MKEAPFTPDILCLLRRLGIPIQDLPGNESATSFCQRVNSEIGGVAGIEVFGKIVLTQSFYGERIPWQRFVQGAWHNRKHRQQKLGFNHFNY